MQGTEKLHRASVSRLVLALTALLFISVPATAQSTRPAPPGRLVDVGGYRVHLYCTGSGGPTVLIAGGGFSFDWDLVQAAAENFTTVCTYDVSGTAWSDSGPKLTCRERGNELQNLIRAAHLQTPLVLTGLSIGGCVVRLYAAEHRSDVAGMVIVDHAFQPDPPSNKSTLGSGSDLDAPPVLIVQTPVLVTVEDSSKFSQLPERIQQLHRWAMSLNPKLPAWNDAEDCLSQLKTAVRGPYPLGDMPLAVVSTDNQAPGYDRLQEELLALSHASSHFVAEHSFHAIEIDAPDVVVAAIRKVVESARMRSPR
jgi:pimeloyl-ACP methyl ester carboxylesterase